VDGECPGLITTDLFQGGLYRIHFTFDEYYKQSNSEIHFPQAEVSSYSSCILNLLQCKLSGNEMLCKVQVLATISSYVLLFKFCSLKYLI